MTELTPAQIRAHLADLRAELSSRARRIAEMERNKENPALISRARARQRETEKDIDDLTAMLS